MSYSQANLMGDQLNLETENARLRKELQANTERFRAFLELTHTAFGCIQFDQPISTRLDAAQQASSMLAGSLVDCNREFAQIYGAHEDDLINARFVSLIFSVEEKFIPRARRFIKAGYRLIGEEIEYQRPDGTKKFLIANVVGEVQSGRLTRLWISYRDVTLQRMVEQAAPGGESQLEDMAGSLDAAFWIMDWKKFQVIYVGAAFETIWQKSRIDLLGDPMKWLERVHPDDQERVKAAFLAHAPTGNYDETFHIVRPDETVRLIRDLAIPIPDATGAVDRIVGLACDITEPHEARLGLDYFFNTAEEMLVVIDADGRFSHINPSFCRVSGYDGAELAGKLVLDWIHPDDRQKAVTTVDNLNSGIPAVDFECRFRCQNGEYKTYRWNISPIGPKGALYGIAQPVNEAGSDMEMSVDDVLSSRLAVLTPRELEVMRLVVAGQPNKSIARQLGISQRTVEKHRGRVMSKLAVENVPDLVRLAITLNLD